MLVFVLFAVFLQCFSANVTHTGTDIKGDSFGSLMSICSSRVEKAGLTQNEVHWLFFIVTVRQRVTQCTMRLILLAFFFLFL